MTPSQSLVHQPTLSDAIALATKLHHGQYRKTGEPFIQHPWRVMQRLGRASLSQCMVAILHDTLEITDLTAVELRMLGYDDVVVQAVELLTHDPETDYMDYILKLRSNPLARAVKRADIEDNLAYPKPAPSAKDIRKRQLYLQALEILA